MYRWIITAAVCLALLTLGAPGTAQAQSYEGEELQLVQLVNDYRQSSGLAPLTLSDPLSAAAERHSEDMGAYGFFSHYTIASSYYPAGSAPWDRMAYEGYYGGYSSENIAYGQVTAEQVFEAWRLSPAHNAAMLGDYRVVGVGQTWVNGIPYWTADFGS